jgi:WD40 repeat protein
VTLVDTRGQEGQRALRVPTGRVRGMAFIPGTPLLAIGGDRGYLALVDYGRGTIVRRLEGLSDPVVDPSVSADGRILIASAQSDNVLIWRLRDGAPTGRPKLFSDELATGNAEVSPDGRRFVVSGPNGIVLVDVATLAHELPLPGSETVGFVAGFTPDGRGVVGGSVDGWTRVWSVRTGRPISPRLTGHTGPIVHTSVSPDGRTLATGSTDGTVRLYDTETWRPLDAPLSALPGRSVSPRFTPDGAYLLAVTTAGRAYRWDVRPAALERNACAIAGRVLTRAEWAAALPGREYAPACAG